MQYQGGKNIYGFYQKIINLIPKHRVYIETHLGSGAIMRFKKPAQSSFGIEIDPQIIEKTKKRISKKNINWVCQDVIQFLKNYVFIGDEFIYCDPPYLKYTCKSKLRVYQHEYSEQQHQELLEILTQLPCKIMISGYYSDLYMQWLHKWNVANFTVRTREGGLGIEYLWMNYEQPTELHDYRYIGKDFRERERIKRKINRWKTKLDALPLLEKKAILSALVE